MAEVRTTQVDVGFTEVFVFDPLHDWHGGVGFEGVELLFDCSEFFMFLSKVSFIAQVVIVDGFSLRGTALIGWGV